MDTKSQAPAELPKICSTCREHLTGIKALVDTDVGVAVVCNKGHASELVQR